MKTIKKIKELKGIIALCLMIGLAASLGGPGVLTAAGTIDTGLTAGSTSGDRPIIKAKWEMLRYYANNQYRRTDPVTGEMYYVVDDDEDEPEAQFNAPGEWNGEMKYRVCAIAAGNVNSVHADIYYPLNRPMHTSMDPDEIDNPSGGCGAWIEENTLVKLDKDDGIDLFCNTIRKYNSNLLTFSDYMTGTDEQKYEDICDPVIGELAEEEAFVYCDYKTLTWEDPAGDYKVKAAAHDLNGPGTPLENTFEYVEFTGFEVDFNSISYPNVVKDFRSQASGDRNFDPSSSDMPTVRNTGNTRLNILVAQDDMEFKKNNDVWNIEYDARVGNDEDDWYGYYNPFKKAGEPGEPDEPTGIIGEPDGHYARLYEILDLSETEKMDFVILVHKWHEGTEFPYAGEMWLDADMADFDSCID